MNIAITCVSLLTMAIPRPILNGVVKIKPIFLNTTDMLSEETNNTDTWLAEWYTIIIMVIVGYLVAEKLLIHNLIINYSDVN